jgi:hypothetical protein
MAGLTELHDRVSASGFGFCAPSAEVGEALLEGGDFTEPDVVARVNGQVPVPAGGQLKVPTPRVDQLVVRVRPPLVLASHAVGCAVGDDDVAVCEVGMREVMSGARSACCRARRRPC